MSPAQGPAVVWERGALPAFPRVGDGQSGGTP